MRKPIAILCGWFLLAQPTWTASFDCSKAQTEVEKTICGDPQLSKLDEKLGKVYRSTMGTAADKKALRIEQQGWLAERTASCGADRRCLTQQYEQRIAALSSGDRCKELQRVLDARRLGHMGDLEIDSLPSEGGDTSYPNLDIDGDGKPDEVIRSCGSGDMACSLFVTLSGGGELELLDEGRFYLGRHKSHLYAIFGDSLTEPLKAKRGKRSAYEITRSGIALVCPKL
jgi:uncharacterized protein YecT (DUF1311 family)